MIESYFSLQKKIMPISMIILYIITKFFRKLVATNFEVFCNKSNINITKKLFIFGNKMVEEQ